MKIDVQGLAGSAPEKLVIHSLDLSLYQASVVINGEEHFLADKQGALLRTRSLLDMQRLCAPLEAKSQVLRQQSAYDEMIGGPAKAADNALEVRLSDNQMY